jgi:hypothetical protein
VQLHRSTAEALQNDIQLTASQRNWFIHLWTHIGVEFILGVRRTRGEHTHAILVSTLLCPSSHLPFFFSISPFSSGFGLLFLHETSQLVSS